MKFRYKVLFVNIIVLSITLAISGYFIVSKQNRLVMDNQIKNSVVENNLVESAIEYSLLDVINDPGSNVADYIPSIAERVAAGMLSASSDLVVTYDPNVLYNTSDEEDIP